MSKSGPLNTCISLSKLTDAEMGWYTWFNKTTLNKELKLTSLMTPNHPLYRVPLPGLRWQRMPNSHTPENLTRNLLVWCNGWPMRHILTFNFPSIFCLDSSHGQQIIIGTRLCTSWHIQHNQSLRLCLGTPNSKGILGYSNVNRALTV